MGGGADRLETAQFRKVKAGPRSLKRDLHLHNSPSRQNVKAEGTLKNF